MNDALTLLRLHMEWGADEALNADPSDRLGTPAPPRPAELSALAEPRAPGGLPGGRPGGAITPPRPLAGPPSGSTIDEATRLTPPERAALLAIQATSLDALREIMAAFDECALRDTASNLVFAEGDPASTTLIVGEPPGREEDRSGRPFAGPDGVLLDAMLASIGLQRSRLMLTPLLPWRPPGGRPPSAGEVAVCLPFLHRLIVLVGPRRLVLFGGSAARGLLAPGLTRRRLTPAWLDCRVPGMPEPLPTLSLPSLLELQRTLPLRRVAWAGLRLLRRSIDIEMT